MDSLLVSISFITSPLDYAAVISDKVWFEWANRCLHCCISDSELELVLMT